MHHVVEWIYGGMTDLDNLCLLCGYHHREFERRGWKVTMRDGRPWWIPPAYVDPERVPIRNTMYAIDPVDAESIPEQVPRLPAEIC